MALTAAAMTAASRFLRSRERHESNWKRARAWQALERDASFASAAEGYPGMENLYDTIRGVLARRTAIMGIDHEPVPEESFGRDESIGMA